MLRDKILLLSIHFLYEYGQYIDASCKHQMSRLVHRRHQQNMIEMQVRVVSYVLLTDI